MDINKLVEKQNKLLNKIEHLKKQQEQKTKEDLQRKKLLIGEYVYNLHEKEGTLNKLAEQMDGFLTSVRDRKLFGLNKKDEK